MIKNKKLKWLLFTAMAVAQIAVPVWMILSKENVIREGKTYKFELQAIDPYDPFRGKYIILEPKENSFTIKTAEQPKQRHMYATFDEDSLGFALIKNLFAEEPDHNDYLKVEIRGMLQKGNTLPVDVIYPFDRYYMNEYRAKAAEDLSRSVARDSSRISYAEVSILKGSSTLRGVFVDGTPIEELISESVEK